VPLSDFMEAYTGKTQIRFTTHQHCGAATYVFVTDEGIVPINRMLDVDTFFEAVENLTDKLEHSGILSRKMVAINGIKELYNSVKSSEKGSTTDIMKLIGKTLISHNYEALRDFHWNALFIGTMHFMDNFNYDIDRVNRCCIHYVTPDKKLIPFCTYNSGPVYREKVWKEHKVAE
jgi:7,8-dihydro-6-hydroxymethylpterin dimethyltransferase